MDASQRRVGCHSASGVMCISEGNYDLGAVGAGDAPRNPLVFGEKSRTRRPEWSMRGDIHLETC